MASRILLGSSRSIQVHLGPIKFIQVHLTRFKIIKPRLNYVLATFLLTGSSRISIFIQGNTKSVIIQFTNANKTPLKSVQQLSGCEQYSWMKNFINCLKAKISSAHWFFLGLMTLSFYYDYVLLFKISKRCRSC